MHYLLLSLLLVIPTVASAQELHTFSNGEVADAEKINENFEALSTQLSSLGGFINNLPPDVDSEGFVSVTVDCNTNPLAFGAAFDASLHHDRLKFNISGSCDLEGRSFDFVGKSVFLRGGDGFGFDECASTNLGNTNGINARDSNIVFDCLVLNSPNASYIDSVVRFYFVEVGRPRGTTPEEAALNFRLYLLNSKFSATLSETPLKLDFFSNSSQSLLAGEFTDATFFLGEESRINCSLCGGSIRRFTLLDSSAWVNPIDVSTEGLQPPGSLPYSDDLTVDFLSLHPRSELHYSDWNKTHQFNFIDKVDAPLVSILNQQSGCSAEQDGSSVVISCADGTTGVLASEGTVVVYPEGGITGESPVQSWPTGTIVFVDANGIHLSEASNMGGQTVFVADGQTGVFVNRPEQEVTMTGWRGGEKIYFLTADCSGQAFGGTSGFLYDTKLGLAVVAAGEEKQSLLFDSYYNSGYGIFATDTYREPGSCQHQQSIKDTWPLVTYSPAQEFVNAAYPVSLEQLP